MKLAYICSPYRAATSMQLDNNIEYAQALTRLALAAGLAPITPHLYLTQVTDDRKPDERAAGLAAGQALLGKCDALLVGNKYGTSEGMQAEIELACRSKMQIISITDDTTPEELRQMIERAVDNEQDKD